MGVQMANKGMWNHLLIFAAISSMAYQTSADYAGYRAVDGNCFGSDLRNLNVTEVECASLCTSAPECDGWVYISKEEANALSLQPDTPCLLKRIMCWKPTPRTDSTYRSYYKEIGAEVPGYKSTSGDCLGNDLHWENTGTQQACGALCTSMPHCAGFLWVRSGTSTWSHNPCILKNRMCEETIQMTVLEFTAYFKVDEGVTVFQETSATPQITNLGDQAIPVHSKIACARRCHRDAECIFFSVSENGGKYSCGMASSMQLAAPAPPPTPYYNKRSVVQS